MNIHLLLLSIQSVKSHPNGTVLYIGSYFIIFYFGGMRFDSLFLRHYNVFVI